MAMVAAEAAAGGGAGAAGAGAAGGGGAAAGGARGAGAARGARAGKAGKASGRSSRGARATRAERGTDQADRPADTRRRAGERTDRSGREEQAERSRYRSAQDRIGSGKSEIRKAKAMLPAKTYHRIVLAEFATCLVLIGAAPIVAPATTSRKGHVEVDTGVSLAGPLVRLTALCVVFFVLALMASGQRAGKVAAAFGGLVTLGVAMNSIEVFTALAKAFGGGKPGPAAPGAGAAAGAAGAAAAGAIPDENTSG